MKIAHFSLASVGVVILSCGVASADRITYNGETWNDVLIYQSSTLYYVKVPDDGTVFNVPIESVDPNDVYIERDPYYRDELKRRFEENVGSRPRRSQEPVASSVFNVSSVDDGAEPGSSAPEENAEEASANPMGAIRGLMENNFGFTFAEDGEDLVATSPDGNTTVRFVGGSPAGGIEYNATVPAAQMQQQQLAVGMLGNMASNAAPWASDFMQQEVAPLLQSGGTAEKSEGPLSISAEVTKGDGEVTVHITATPAAS